MNPGGGSSVVLCGASGIVGSEMFGIYRNSTMSNVRHYDAAAGVDALGGGRGAEAEAEAALCIDQVSRRCLVC